jgi:hypothetical protein
MSAVMNIQTITPHPAILPKRGIKPVAQLTVAQQANKALDSKATEKTLKKLVLKSVSIVTINSIDGRAQCHSAYMTLRDTRVSIEKVGKAAREEPNAFCAAVIQEEDRLIALISPEEKRLLALRKDYDEKIEREEKERIAKEKARVELIDIRINAIHLMADGCEKTGSIGIKAVLEKVNALAVTEDEFEEFIDAADQAKAEVINRLTTLMMDAIEREDEDAARQEALAAENKRLESLREEARKIEEQKAELQRQLDDMKRTRNEAKATSSHNYARARHHPTNTVAAAVELHVEEIDVGAVMPTNQATPVGDLLDCVIPTAPSADEMILVIADCFDVTQEIARKWLAATSFN